MKRVRVEYGIELATGEKFLWRFELQQERHALCMIGCMAADPDLEAFTYQHAAKLCQRIREENRRLREYYGIPQPEAAS